MAKALVEHPEGIVVMETVRGGKTIVELKVAPFGMGKVIGKQGRIVKVIHSIVKTAVSREDKKVIVEIQ